MRRVYRSELVLTLRLQLYRLSKAVDGGADAGRLWQNFRASNAGKAVVSVLKDMAGYRGRCFYCSDSRGADIDHFRPIALDSQGAFKWKNFIWVCPECNRKKGARYPLTADESPLLIDPTREDPWRFLVLDAMSGWIAPRFHDDGTLDAKGEATLQVFDTINYEATADGRRAAIRRFLNVVEDAISESDWVSALRLLAEYMQHDEYGVAAWFVIWEGSEHPRAVALRATYPEIGRRMVGMTVAPPGRSRALS